MFVLILLQFQFLGAAVFFFTSPTYLFFPESMFLATSNMFSATETSLSATETLFFTTETLFSATETLFSATETSLFAHAGMFLLGQFLKWNSSDGQSFSSFLFISTINL